MREIVEIVSANWIYIVLVYSYAVSYMLYDFMQDGMIFSFYGKWLKSINSTLAKPLGACLKCFHVWIFITLYIISLYMFNQSFNVLLLIIALGFSYHNLVKNYYN